MSTSSNKPASWRASSPLRSSLPSLLDINLNDIATGLDEGQFTVLDLVKAYSKRIEEVDGYFRSIIEVNPDAEDIARSLDEEIQTSGRRGPLHGVPIVLKDNIVTLDKMEATAGSCVLLGAKPANEAMVAANLRKAGCVILGKAAPSEWANYRWTNAPVREQHRFRYGNKSRSVLRCYWNRDGRKRRSDRVDAIGVFARNVKDTAVILSAAAGKSHRDPATDEMPFDKIPDYGLACSGSDLRGVRIGVPTTLIGVVEPEEAASFKIALSELDGLGAQSVHHVEFEGEKDWKATTSRQRRLVNQGDLLPSLERYLRTLETNPLGLRTLKDITEQTKEDPREDFPAHDVEGFEFSLSLDRNSQEMKEVEALRAFIIGEGGINAAMDRYRLDVLVTPTCSKVPLTFASVERSPILSFPLGFYPDGKAIQKDSKGDHITVAPGVPYPICFYGRRFAEQTLIKIAHAFEGVHNKGPYELYKLPNTDLEQVVKERESESETDSEV
ncbi:hypothetical protein OQA88_2109 [Cercophora sp. LCS_1]